MRECLMYKNGNSIYGTVAMGQKVAEQEFEYVQGVFADYCSGRCVDLFCGILHM